MSKLTELGLRHPDERDYPLTGFSRKADALYKELRVAVFIGKVPAEVLSYLESKRMNVVLFPEDPATWPAIFAANAQYFKITR